MSRRLIVCGVAAAAVLGAVIPSFASPRSPVTVTRTSSGTTVAVTDNGAPVAGATVYNNGQVCGGIGEQVPVCTPAVGDAIGPIGAAGTAQSSAVPPVTVRHDDNGTAVGVGDVGVIVYPDGSICPVISTDNVRCIPAPAN